MNHFQQKYGPWALITGASSGIGAEFARQLGNAGLNVILVARRRDRLEEIAHQIREQFQVETRVIAADLSAPDFMDTVRQTTDGLEIGLLVNNAGFAIAGDFLQNDLTEELEMLHLNARAPLILSHEFGKKMVERKRGGIIFTSSVIAAFSMPHMINYSGTKAFDLNLGQGLWGELKSYGVDVLTLCPGNTITEFHDRVRIKAVMAMQPPVVVEYALANLGRKIVAIPGLFNKLAFFTTRLIPYRLLSFFASLSYKRMKHEIT